MLVNNKVNMLIVFFIIAFLSNYKEQQPTVVKTGSISGVITDQAGFVLVNAKVLILNQLSTRDNKTYETVSDVKGKFKLSNLPFGVYNVHIEASGFNIFVANSVNIASKETGFHVRLNFKNYHCEVEGKEGITDADKAYMVRQILEHVFVIRDWPGPSDLLEEGLLGIRAYNIKPDWLLNIRSDKLFLLSSSNWLQDANSKQIHYYLTFDKFEVKGSCVMVVLIRGIVPTKTLEEASSLEMGTDIYEFRRDRSQWSGKYLGGWVF